MTMASAWYPLGKQALLNKQIDVDTDTIKVRAVASEDYTYSAAHNLMDDITKYGSSTDATVTISSIAAGVVDGADLSPAFTALAVDGTKDIDYLVVFYFNTNDAGSSPLVFIDLGAGAVRPNSGNINITWDAAGIATL
jgi:hypothetical protein